MKNLKSTIAEFDLFIIIAALCIIGLISLHSTSYAARGLLEKDFAKIQLIWILFSLAVVFFVLWYGYEKLIDKAYILYAVNIVLLLAVLFIGKSRLGARRWINLGFFLLQPAELCKVAFILVLVRYIVDNRYKLDGIRGVIIPFIITLLPVVLIIKQPDLGTAITLLPVFFALLFASGIKKRQLFLPAVAGVISLPFLWNILRPYQKNRIMVFLNPDMDPLGAGYTVIQSKIAIGSGGLWGKGWLAGTQNQLNFLPERHTDFIFSVIGEEWGFLGAILVLILFLLLFRRLLKIADSTTDLSGKLIVIAAVTLLWFQVFVNIAMVMGLIPTVGLPLPFLTYGGSNLITAMFLVALAKSVEQRRKVF